MRPVPEGSTPPLAGARVLVTGASGLIGSHLLRVLDSTVEVVGVSRAARPDGDGVRWLTCDLAQPGAVEYAVDAARPDVIVHLAGAVRGDRTLDAVVPTLRANLLATVELLDVATRAGCRRIVMSGSLMEEPVSGAPDGVPPSPYGASRWAASSYGRMFHALFDAPVVILRPSYAYGPGQEDSKLIPYVTKALLEGESPELSSGERLIDWVYAEDVARAYLAAASAAGVEGRTLDVGSGIVASVNEVVLAIADAVGPTGGTPRFGAVAARPLEQDVVPDIEATAAMLGWRATTGLEEGLRRTVEWYREQGAR
jgi:nucleoside-diphosphate-sugar epimerase